MKYSRFYDDVYQIVGQIPKGRIATYGQIAAILGKPFAARQVGEAMRKTPEFLDIPCHRVVNRTGALAPEYAFGGAGKQRERLECEGIKFKENGCVDVNRCIWR